MLALVGDGTAQTIEKREGQKQTFDWHRAFAFSVHNGVWTAFGLHPILNFIDRKVPGLSLRAVAVKTAFQLAVMDPLFYLPSVYLGNGLLLAQDMTTIWTKVSEEFWPTALTMWKFWGPVTVLQFRFVPVRHQANFINIVDAMWLILLSTLYNTNIESESW
jgi:hypothetical protein